MKIDALKSELEKLNVQELATKIATMKQELFTLRINIATTHVKDYSQFKKIRKNIARSLTYLRHKNA